MLRELLPLLIIGAFLFPQDGILDFGSINFEDNFLEVLLDIQEVTCGYSATVTGIEFTGIEQVMWPQCAGGVSDDGYFLGWFMTGMPLDPGSGVLVNLFFESGPDTVSCIIDPYFADCMGGGQMEIVTGECVFVDFPPFLIAGDMNQDGSLDVLDIIQAVNLILSDIEPDPFEQYIADLNEDGDVDILDVVIIVDVIVQGK